MTIACGSRCPGSILIESDIAAIFSLSATGMSQYEIAEIYMVNQSNVSRILNQKIWRHVGVEGEVAS